MTSCTPCLTEPTLREGSTYPLGAQVQENGVNFAVFSEHAQRVDLCVFDAEGHTERQRLALHGPHEGVFHGFLPGAGPGLVYGFRAHGPFSPQQGHRFNPHKLLLDPYAREVVGRFQWAHELHAYRIGHEHGPNSFDEQDSAPAALKARVAAPLAPLPRRARLRAPGEVVLYEVHVKGFSMTHPEIPAGLRGTYGGLAHPASVAHFRRLGVTTLSLLPVQYCVDEPALAARQATNYWGYNTLGFFCPDPRWAAQGHDPSAVVHEFRAMVQALHEAGLEVVLDVVYNHTPEGNEWGPTLSFRGLDNANWYHLDAHDKSRCENISGCGNTVNVAHPRVTQFVLDSLRYWVEVMGVDGFRFDLATVLGRDAHGFHPDAPFFVALRQDPVLAQVHLIAEPWDGGPNGYQVGRFPPPFADWNDRFRDTVRAYWLQRGVSRGELVQRFTGSHDLFGARQRRPNASVNFITVHDGFTLADVVSYSHKHNHANGENNADGRDGELCANHGAEGPSDDPGVRDVRDRVRRAMLATLLLAQGTPMLCAGDEIGKTQNGNNNAYCQDNALSWLDWSSADQPTLHFVQQALALRRAQPSLHHADWFDSHGLHGPQPNWRTPEGQPMQAHDWQSHEQGAFLCRLSPDPADASASVLLLVFNPTGQNRSMALPAGGWRACLDSSLQLDHGHTFLDRLDAPAHSLVVLQPTLTISPEHT